MSKTSSKKDEKPIEFDPKMRETQFTVHHKNPNSIKPYVNNAKAHPAEQIEALMLQISRFGFDQPITVDKDGVIITGHGRQLAAIKLGLTVVPVIVRDDLSEHDIMAKRLADNRVAQSDNIDEMIAFEMGTLDRAGYDLSLTAFDEKEIKDFLQFEPGGDDLSSGVGSGSGLGAGLKQYIVSCECKDEVMMADLYQELKNRDGLKVTLIT